MDAVEVLKGSSQIQYGPFTTGGTGTLDQFNVGAVDVNGLELLLNYNLKIKEVRDLIAKYALTRHVSMSLAANNLFNHRYLASLSPYGLRPGMPRTIMVGMSVKF